MHMQQVIEDRLVLEHGMRRADGTLHPHPVDLARAVATDGQPQLVPVRADAVPGARQCRCKSAGTTRTAQVAVSTTRSLVLPSIWSRMPAWPCWPTMIRSAPISWA